MKKFFTGILSGVAVALGVTAFIFWKRQHAEGNRTIAAAYLENPFINTDKVVAAAKKEDAKHEEQIEAVKNDIEQRQKEKIINDFKKAFGISGTDPVDDSGAPGSV